MFWVFAFAATFSTLPFMQSLREIPSKFHFGKADTGCASSPNIQRREGSIDAYIWVSDLDLLYAELKERGAKIVEPPTTQVYKCYEMIVEDGFSFRLAFGMDVSSRPDSSSRS